MLWLRFELMSLDVGRKFEGFGFGTWREIRGLELGCARGQEKWRPNGADGDYRTNSILPQ